MPNPDQDLYLENQLAHPEGMDKLFLRGKIPEESVVKVVEILKKGPPLSEICLTHGDLNPSHISRMLLAGDCWDRITILNLNHNSLSAAGVVLLVDALRLSVNSTLLVLKVTNNWILNEGAVALSEALKSNTQLTRLSLGINNFSEAGAHALAELLCENSTLRALNIRSNPIGKIGACAVVSGLRKNRTLRELSWPGSALVKSAGEECLTNALPGNFSLSKFKGFFYGERARYLDRNRILAPFVDLYYGLIDYLVERKAENDVGIVKAMNALRTSHPDLNLPQCHSSLDWMSDSENFKSDFLKIDQCLLKELSGKSLEEWEALGPSSKVILAIFHARQYEEDPLENQDQLFCLIEALVDCTSHENPYFGKLLGYLMDVLQSKMLVCLDFKNLQQDDEKFLYLYFLCGAYLRLMNVEKRYYPSSMLEKVYLMLSEYYKKKTAQERDLFSEALSAELRSQIKKNSLISGHPFIHEGMKIGTRAWWERVKTPFSDLISKVLSRPESTLPRSSFSL